MNIDALSIQELARHPALFVLVCVLIAFVLSALLVGVINWTSARNEAKRKALEAEQSKFWKTPKPPAPKPHEFWK